MPDASCRLLPFAIAAGPSNMAADEVLLETAAAGVASLRLYGWSKATLSLGYFQPEKLRLNDSHFSELPYVRRPSGGGTLVHHHEVTYCLALPAGRPWQTGESWLCGMHGIITAALEKLGVAAKPQVAERRLPFKDVLCFQHFTPGDLMIGSSKITGSAQRRQRGALMQHGSILLAQSPYTPSLPGIRELCKRELTGQETCEAVQHEFARQIGWLLASGEWTAAEIDRISCLESTKYSQDHWNRKR